MDETPDVDFGRIAHELGLTREQVTAVAALLDEGNTVPFITRYRKERTGNLDEEPIRRIQQRVRSHRQLAQRAQTILRLFEAQGHLTPDLKDAVARADSLKRLEDLYLPYRPKRRSRATQAREQGLESLAATIWKPDLSVGDLSAAAEQFVDLDNDVPTVEHALQGAADILAEQICEEAEVRQLCRRIAWQTGRVTVTASKSALTPTPSSSGDQPSVGARAGERVSGQEYRNYFDYSEAVTRIPPHRCLAINRGEKAGALRVKFEWDESQARTAVAGYYRLEAHRFADFLHTCVVDALSRLILPSLQREIRRELTEKAETHAVIVFARNLRNLLLSPPLQGQRVTALDPGYRTGCKVAALDELGHCLGTELVYVTGSQEKRKAEQRKLAAFMTQHGCDLVAIGNGTACRETEELVSQIIAEYLPEARYIIVNEAGASVYSTSPAAREELPEFDATVRGTISIGRRLQDPLSELVKIDPKHIGVGMYQHDISAKRLQESLEEVIESCVNYVGVDLNSASASLLRRVSGFNQLIARRVAEWREQNGRFTNRRQLLEVPGLGEATFTQAAGFLKIAGGDEPLDATWIHPESYGAARRILDRLLRSPEHLVSERLDSGQWQQRLSEWNRAEIARELSVGLPTFNDIVEALSRPGRDPRTDLPPPVFRQGVLTLDDLAEGMKLTGTVLNVVDFGAFVDIGLKDSGLVHVSEMRHEYVQSPHDLVAVGDVLTVWVLGVDHERRRVSLTMIDPAASRPRSRDSRREEAPASPKRRTGRSERSVSAAKSKRRDQYQNGEPAPRKPPTPQPTAEQVSGSQPLKGFDELKELWEKRR